MLNTALKLDHILNGNINSLKTEILSIDWISDGSNNCNCDTTACFLTPAPCGCDYRNRGYFKKFLHKIKFILPMLKFDL